MLNCDSKNSADRKTFSIQFHIFLISVSVKEIPLDDIVKLAVSNEGIFIKKQHWFAVYIYGKIG